jgi:hypothetical protein
MTTCRDATDEDCMLCQHLLCDDRSVLGLVVRYYEDVPTYLVSPASAATR